jgi:hypothetical protein
MNKVRELAVKLGPIHTPWNGKKCDTCLNITHCMVFLYCRRQLIFKDF